jgi:hypothetical protein
LQPGEQERLFRSISGILYELGTGIPFNLRKRDGPQVMVRLHVHPEIGYIGPAFAVPVGPFVE